MILRIRHEGVVRVKQRREKVNIRVLCQGHCWELWDLSFTGIVRHVHSTSQNFQLKNRKLGRSSTGSFPHWLKAALKLFNSLLFWIVLLGSWVDSCSFGKCLKASNGMLPTCPWVHMVLSTAAAAEIRGELRGCEAVQQKPMMQLAMISESNTSRDIFILQTLKLSLEQRHCPLG